MSPGVGVTVGVLVPGVCRIFERARWLPSITCNPFLCAHPSIVRPAWGLAPRRVFKIIVGCGLSCVRRGVLCRRRALKALVGRDLFCVQRGVLCRRSGFKAVVGCGLSCVQCEVSRRRRVLVAIVRNDLPNHLVATKGPPGSIAQATSPLSEGSRW